MNIKDFCDFLEKKGKPLMALVAVSIILSLIGIFRVNIVTSFDLFAPKDSPYKQGKKLMDEAFGDTSQMLLLAPGKATPKGIRTIVDFTRECDKIPGIARAMAAFPDTLADQEDSVIKKQLSMLMQLNVGIKGIITDSEGTWFLIRLQMKEKADYRLTVKAVKALADQKIPGYSLSGEPFLESEIFNYVLQILLFLPPMAIFLMLLVFRLRIGSFRATILSMIPAIIGAVLTLGILSWVRGSISIMSVLVPIFIIVLGSADGLHVTSHVMDQLGKGATNKEAIAHTLKAVGIPIILTSLTTMAGFLSLLTIHSAAIQEMAITAAGGILLAGVVTWIILPIMLFHQKPLPAKDQAKVSRIAQGLYKLTGVRAVLISLVLIGVSVPGLLKLRADFSMTDMYKPETAVRKSIEELGRHVGGAYPQMVLIKAKDVYYPDFAKSVLAFQRDLEKEGLITSSVSVYSVIKQIAGMMGPAKGYPDSQFIAQFISAQMKSQNPDLYHSFVSESGWIRVLLFTDNQHSDTLDKITQKIAALEKETGHQAYPVGTAFEIMSMNIRIINQLIQSLIIALASVFLLTSIFVRSFKAGLVSIVPIMITLAGLFAVMGFMKIDISIITSIMSGMTIGVGIDYAIHFTSLFYHFKREGHKKPATEALHFVATPVLANAMGLSIGFTVMILSPLQIHTTLSLLMWVTMLLSAFLSLSLLPGLLGIGREKKLVD